MIDYFSILLKSDTKMLLIVIRSHTVSLMWLYEESPISGNVI